MINNKYIFLLDVQNNTFQVKNTGNLKNRFIIKNKQVVDTNNCSTTQFTTKRGSNKVAAWRAQRNAREIEASRLIRLDRESNARTVQRRKRSRLTSTTEHCISFEDNTDNSKNETSNKEMNEILEKNVGKLNTQSKEENKLRKVRSLEETEGQHKTVLYDKMLYKLTNWCNRKLLVGLIIFQFIKIKSTKIMIVFIYIGK